MAVFVLLILYLFIREFITARKNQALFEKKLYERYGELPERVPDPERMRKIKNLYDKRKKEGQIDDITWHDLGMDALFYRMNHTLSATGEECLYETLHDVGRSQEMLAHMEEQIVYFQTHDKERVQVQLKMHELGFTGKFSLYDYLAQLDNLGERSNRRQIFLNALFLPLLALVFISAPLAMAGIACLMCGNIATYFREKKEIEPYIVSFAYIMRLLKAGEAVVGMPLPVCAEELENLREYLDGAKRIRAGSFWVMWQSSGNPLDIIVDYFRMIFHTDIMIFNKMYRQLLKARGDIDGIIRILGGLETVIAVGAFRASLKQGYCVPVFDDSKELSIQEVYHPLVDDCVKNSITTDRGVLLTGSNASGKSTFLRTVALNAILAQTIHTCTAASYEAPLYRIYSSMSLVDDLESGESYYMVEIKTLKRILDEACTYDGKVLCFVDEVLRGTNTVERIAASSQILQSLAGSDLLCFAATHDIELTYLLEDTYENYHFEEEIKDGDVLFDYRLRNGRATTRNAIRLLDMLGYSEDIIRKATAMADQFLQTGKWK